MFPAKTEYVPIVAELPTTQKTLQAWVSLMRLTTLAGVETLPAAVMSVDAVWKMKIELGLPSPLRVRVPVISNVPDVEL